MNGRLWGLYRGMKVGPYPLESMLMALESWLLEIGQQEPERLDAILVDILRRSDNAALAAVVASVATAYPLASGEGLLVLLSVREYIAVDRSRLVDEQQMAGMAGMITTMRADHQAYEMERKQADALPHRQYDLEAAVLNLQRGPFAPRVHALLDNHLAALPPKEQQDKDDRLCASPSIAWISASTPFPTHLAPKSLTHKQSQAIRHGDTFPSSRRRLRRTCRPWSMKAPLVWPR